MILPGSKLYYKEKGLKYYGIPVAPGKRLTEGVVVATCEAAGMRAVCPGGSSCSYYSSRCDVVPIELSVKREKGVECHYTTTMLGLSKKVCPEEKNPGSCKQLWGLFAYHKGFRGSAFGRIKGRSAQGHEYISGKYNVYYAYCVKG